MGKQKFISQTDMKVGIIADEDTVTGLLLAGAGMKDGSGKTNFLICGAKTHVKEMEEKFNELVGRRDISMVLITQGCADDIRYAVEAYTSSGKVIPTVLEIPSKEQAYDPRKDAVMQRVAVFMPTAMAELGVEA
uniref:V-type proton ATPase subunit F n=1 Tax=Noctiluca scintillans TaxID=2966 RepID=A0A7S1AL06_NOCSC